MVCESGWDVIYGKAVYTMSLIDAIYRGLLPCIRSAIEVSPSLQNQCMLSLIQRAMSEQIMQSDLSEPIPKKQKTVKDEHANLSTTKTVTTNSLVDNVSDVERSLVDEIITNFVARVAEWTENEKEMHRKRLSRIDVIRYRKEWAAAHAMDDFDVEDDDASCWKKCDEKDWDDMTNEAEYLKEDFEAMIMQLSRVLVGTSPPMSLTISSMGTMEMLAFLLSMRSRLRGLHTRVAIERALLPSSSSLVSLTYLRGICDLSNLFPTCSDLMTAQPSQTCRTNTQGQVIPRPVMVGGKESRREMMTSRRMA